MTDAEWPAGLSNRTRNALERNGIWSIKQMRQPEFEPLRMEGIGRRGLAEIDAVLGNDPAAGFYARQCAVRYPNRANKKKQQPQIEKAGMTPDEFKAAIAAARLSTRALAEWMGYASNTPIVRMTTGAKQIPEPLVIWLLRRIGDPPPRVRD